MNKDMKTLHFTTEINASQEKVWDVLWNDETYSEWTRFFNPSSTSFIKADWRLNGEVRFLDGDNNGMLSRIQTYEPPHIVVFEHYGETNKGVDDTTSDRVKQFAGALESYELTEVDHKVILKGSVQTSPEWEKMMSDGFTKGFQSVKEIAES